jgi:hypothetical protein
MLAVVYFRHGGISMAPAILPVIAFLALLVWRFVFVGPHHWPLVRAIAPRQHRRNSILEEVLHISDPGGVAVIAGNRFENSSDSPDPIDRRDRATVFLRRIVALTGATQMGEEYVLNVGATRFHVRNGYIRRLRVAADPQCAYEETCFYPVHKGMPKAEEIATALLQLANNPALFDKWAARNGQAIKADGQVFSGAQ